MSAFTGSNSGHTPSTSVDNWTLDAGVAGEVGRILSISWGGELIVSTGYHTRWVRPLTAGVGALTAIAPGLVNPNSGAPALEFGQGFATTEPILPAEKVGDLHNQNWNAHGGLGYVSLPLASPWQLINGALLDQLSCRNLAGVDAGGSSYGVTWDE